MEYVKGLLKQIGLEQERVQMYNLSSAMAGEFINAVKETTERISIISKNPLFEENQT